MQISHLNVHPSGPNQIAAGKPTYQISTYVYLGDSQNAVDGNPDRHYMFGQSCSHTKEDETDPWWLVDLGKEYLIQNVLITNRKDCCGK